LPSHTLHLSLLLPLLLLLLLPARRLCRSLLPLRFLLAARYHGFSVLHFSYLSLRLLTNSSDYLTQQDVLALMVASLCHDVAHPGNTNSFEINTASELGTAPRHSARAATAERGGAGGRRGGSSACSLLQRTYMQRWPATRAAPAQSAACAAVTAARSAVVRVAALLLLLTHRTRSCSCSVCLLDCLALLPLQL